MQISVDRGRILDTVLVTQPCGTLTITPEPADASIMAVVVAIVTALPHARSAEISAFMVLGLKRKASQHQYLK